MLLLKPLMMVVCLVMVAETDGRVWQGSRLCVEMIELGFMGRRAKGGLGFTVLEMVTRRQLVNPTYFILFSLRKTPLICLGARVGWPIFQIFFFFE